MESKIIKRKINWIRASRRAVQLISFILMPGLFLSNFMAIKSIYVTIISGTFSFAAQLQSILLLAAVLPATMLMGRFFCGYLCSFGALGDLVWFVARKISKKKIKVGEKTDRVLKYFKYALLAFIVVFVWTLGAVALDPSVNPWNVFGMYSSLSGWASLSGLLTVGGFLLLVIIIGSAFVERFFCRYMCPLGAVFALLSKIKILKIKKPTEECRSCTACTKGCGMGIDLYKHDIIKSGECINCMECISACPRSNSQVTFLGRSAAPIAFGIIASAVIAGLYFGGKTIVQTAYAAPAGQMYVAPAEKSGPFTDGAYTGSASGYRGTTTVEVTIENGYIAMIEVVSTDDDMEFLLPARNSVVSDILETQSPDVDAVTGATYSSYAIMNAVYDALLKCSAGMDYCMPTQEPVQEILTAEELGEIEANPAFVGLSDGTYTGKGRGYYGDTIVDVTVGSGKITAIEVVSTADDRPYLERAENVIEDVIETQDIQVDTVSGATVSSNGILEAVADALGLDYERAPEFEGGGGRQHRGGGH